MIKLQTPYGLLTFTFQRRRYGRQSYCWANVINGCEQISLGDPWPGINFPRKALMESLCWALAGKVLVPPAICAECREAFWHSQTCSRWRQAVEVAPGTWESERVAVAPAGFEMERAA